MPHHNSIAKRFQFTQSLLAVAGLTLSLSSMADNNPLVTAGCDGSNNAALACKHGVVFVKDAAALTAAGIALENQKQQTAQFSNNHYAILVAPGQYNMVGNDQKPRAFNLGYYTQVLGVGKAMDDVVINPGVEAYNQDGMENTTSACANPDNKSRPAACKEVGGLNNFWRGIENFKIARPGATDPLIFAVSQAAPIRSVHFTGTNVLLCDFHTADWGCGYVSGGFMANSIVEQALIPGAQQQWITRNSQINPTISETAVWNSVFVGTSFSAKSKIPAVRHPENNTWDNYPVSNINQTPVSKEKPYLTCDTTCNDRLENIEWKVATYSLRTGSVGPNKTPAKLLDVKSDFYVLSADNRSAEGVATVDAAAISAINAALASGKHLLVTPGVYNLDGGAINVTKNDTVVLGIGMPSLVCTSGQECIHVTASEGVNLAGITVEAGYKLTPNLIQIGSAGNQQSNPANPILLHDVFFRIAETQLSDRIAGQERQTKTALTIYTNNVIGDNLWIWRADHDKPTSKPGYKPPQSLVHWDQDKAQYGLIVYGNNVTMNGLFVEHFQDYQTVWYGENGVTNFYQSEMPYDVPSIDKWTCHDPKTAKQEQNGCASYVVRAKNHQANGMGVYTYFPLNKSVFAPTAILVPSDLSSITLNHLMGKWLNGVLDSGYYNLAMTDDRKTCFGFGVNKTPIANQFSSLGVVSAAAAKGECATK